MKPEKVILSIDPKKKKGHINPEIYGQFSEHLGRCIYEGIYVGEDSEIPNVRGIRTDIVEALKAVKLPVLRWPGGCFADEYHWRDGIGPKETRRRMVNTNWGGVVEDNSFGTHEFMDLCEQIGCEPYIAVNMGSGTVQEAAEWVEYMTADSSSSIAAERAANGRKEPWRFKYLGIGNESWGCGGSMEPEYYASEYKRYQTFCKDYNGNHLYKIACGPNADDYHWTKVLLQHVNEWHTKGISLHYYTLPSGDWNQKGSATQFSEQEYYQTIRQTMRMEEIIQGHLKVMDELDPEHHIALIVDEWGTWYDVEPGTNPGFLYQQNTMRDAIVAAYNLNLFNKYSERIAMANIAQVVNVLQAMILTEGAKIVTTPTYEVFQMYADHQDAALLDSYFDKNIILNDHESIALLTESVSLKEKDGKQYVTITLSNQSLTEEAEVAFNLLSGCSFTGNASVTTLHAEAHAYNSFEEPHKVAAVTETMEAARLKEGAVTLKPCSVVTIICEVAENA